VHLYIPIFKLLIRTIIERFDLQENQRKGKQRETQMLEKRAENYYNAPPLRSCGGGGVSYFSDLGTFWPSVSATCD